MEDQLTECVAKVSRMEDVLLQVSSNILEIRKFTTDFEPRISVLSNEVSELKKEISKVKESLDDIQTNLYTLADKVEYLLNSNS